MEKKTLLQTWIALILEGENSWQKAWVGGICVYPDFQSPKARGEAEQGVTSAGTPFVSPG